MSKLKIKSGKSELVLRKSKSLVGLKTSEEGERAYVKEEVIRNLGGFEVVALEGDDVDQKLDEVRARDEVEVGTHIYFPEGSDRPVVATGEIFIRFEEGAGEGEQQIVLDEYKLALVERRSDTDVVAKVTPQSPNPFKVVSQMQELSLVRFAEADIDTVLDEYAFVPPSDHLLPHQWYFENIGRVPDANFRLKAGADARVKGAWQRLGHTGSNTVTVAVIDNGFDLSHPDLKDKIFKPYNVWDRNSNIPQGQAMYTHGTPCASVAVAATNGQGIVGAAPNARFMPVHGTSFSIRETEDMFGYCMRNGADIISCSWGTTDPAYTLGRLKEEAIAAAAGKGRNGKGCVILFAVGNDDKDFVNFYAAHPDVIAVAASTSQDAHASYSNRGREVTVCAPSNGDWPIIAARAWWDQGLSWETGNFKFWRDGRPRGDRYKHFGGTSAATPLVAGICALMLSANPDLTAREVKEILTRTADKIGSPWEYDSRGHSAKYGYGRVNADKAVAEALRRREFFAPTPEPAPTPTPTPRPTPTPTPTPTPAPVEDTVVTGQGLFRFSVEKQPPSGWGVQIGVFYEYGNVLVQTEKLQSQFGEPVVVHISELGGKTAYRLMAGAFPDKFRADQLKRKLQERGVNGFTRSYEGLV